MARKRSRRRKRRIVPAVIRFVLGRPCAAASLDATLSFKATKLSGLTEIESMPHSPRNSANAG
jgi:hypothetical protein